MQRIGFYFALVRGAAAASCPGISAVQLDKELLSGTPSRALDLQPQPSCDLDTCKIIGDPHVTRFDRKWMSLLDTKEQESQSPGMEAGTYYVLKDNDINIQATFGLNGPVLTRLAIGGKAVANGSAAIIIQGENVPDGEPIQQNTDQTNGLGSASFFIFGGSDYFDSGGYLAFQRDVPLIQRGEDEKTTPGYEFIFFPDDVNRYLRIVVNRKAKSLNVAISRCNHLNDAGYNASVIDQLGDDVAIGFCGSNDPSTTVAPQDVIVQNVTCAESGTCNVYGDPHITSFNRQWMSLFQLDGHMEMERTGQKPGDFWLVESDSVKIQARFGRNGPMMTHVAVGGDFMKGNVLVIGAQKDAASWNGKPIMTEFPSTFESDDGIAKITYSDQTSLVQRRDGIHRNVPGMSIKLPKDVELTVNRMPRSINLAITMCEAGLTIGGYCGNLQAADDVMLDQDHTPYEVQGGQSLFRVADDLKNAI